MREILLSSLLIISISFIPRAHPSLGVLLVSSAGYHARYQETKTQGIAKIPQRCWAAEEAFRTGQFERAADLARLCLLQEGESSETYKLLALSSFMLQHPDDFRTNMEKALALNPSDGGAYYHLGRFYYEKKQYKEALDRLGKAAELDPENYKAFYFSGLCLQGSGEDEKAAARFRKAIEIIERKKIRYGWPYADLGELIVLRGEFEKGLSWIYRATRNDPSLPYTHFVYARALLRKEASLEVEQSLLQSIKLDPGYTEAYYLLGRYYTKTGDQERAKGAFAKFDELRKSPVPSPYGLRR